MSLKLKLHEIKKHLNSLSVMLTQFTIKKKNTCMMYLPGRRCIFLLCKFISEYIGGREQVIQMSLIDTVRQLIPNKYNTDRNCYKIHLFCFVFRLFPTL